MYFLPLFSHDIDVRFNRITMEDGLSHNSVSAIVQDQEGFIWLGTQEGLNRYDGQNFIKYFNKPFDNNSLSNNLIQSLYIDGETLWVGTYKGLNKLNIYTGNVDRYIFNENDPESISNDVITAISKDSQGQIWVGTLNGLNRLDEENGNFIRYFSDAEDENSLPHNVIRSIHKDKDDQLWIGSYGGLSLYQQDKDCFSSPIKDFPSSYVMDIRSEKRGEILLGIWGAGLCRINTEILEYEIVELPDDRIYKVLITQENYWAASYGGGLIEYYRDENESIVHNSHSHSSSPIENDTIYALFEDPSGILWIGTNGGGIFRIIPGWERFDLWVNQPDKDSLEKGQIQGIYLDRNEELWVSIYNKGLDRLDIQGKRLAHYAHRSDDPYSLPDDIVQFVYQDSRSRTWIGTNGGLTLYDPEQDRFISDKKSFKLDLPQEDMTIYSMAEDRQGNLWIGSYNHGLMLFSPEGLLMNHFTRDDGSGLSDNLIRRLLITQTGDLWVGTNKGLNRYNPETHNFTSYYHNEKNRQGLSSDNIQSLFEDSHGRLWIGTSSGGLNWFAPEENRFYQQTLGNNSLWLTINNVEEDRNGNLWVSSRQGLTRISSDRMKYTGINSAMGFPEVQLSLGSARDSRGELYFGSSSGLVIVHPDKEPANPMSSRLKLTSIKVMGQPYKPEIPPFQLETIHLDHRDSLIEFDFAQLNYLAGLSTRYAYILDGLETEWHDIGQERQGSYNNLHWGHYILKIRAYQSLGADTDITGEISIPLEIAAPFWVTFPAISIYILFLLTLAGIILRRIKITRLLREEELRKERLFKKELELQVEQRTRDLQETLLKKEEIEEKLFQSEKLSAIGQLAGGIAHDFNNQLQGIIGFAESLQSDTSKEEHEIYLQNILHSAANAAELTQKLLAFARKGNRNFQELSITTVIEEVLTIFTHSIDKKIELISHFKQDIPQISGDRTQLQNAILNILLNSRDAIEGSGSISIDCELTCLKREGNGVMGEWIPPGDYIKVEIKDTGSGIPREIQNRIFEPFYTTKDVSKGTGMGLPAVYGTIKSHEGYLQVQSEPGNGTTFLLYFPPVAEN